VHQSGDDRPGIFRPARPACRDPARVDGGIPSGDPRSAFLAGDLAQPRHPLPRSAAPCLCQLRLSRRPCREGPPRRLPRDLACPARRPPGTLQNAAHTAFGGPTCSTWWPTARASCSRWFSSARS
jgi:hypothetical protein